MKTYFLSRNLREKILVLLMLLVGLVIWGTGFSDRTAELLAERRSLNALHREYMVYVDNQALIRERAEHGIRNLDPTRMLNGTRLSVETEAMARTHGLVPSISTPDTAPGDIFSNHTVRVTVSDADIGSLIEFTHALQARAPYMSLEKVTINAHARNPMLLDASFRVSAVELNRDYRDRSF